MAAADTVVPRRALFGGHADDASAYAALRNECAAFDRSDVDLLRVRGRDADAALQRVTTRDLEYLAPERCTTGLVLCDDGSLVDVVTIHRFDDSFLVETSPGRGPQVIEHLAAHAGDDDVTVEDVAGALVSVAVEGPYAWNAAGRIVAPELAALPLDSAIEATWQERPLVFCRTGVTGEYGYKFVGDALVIAGVAAELAKDVVVAGPAVQATAMLEVRHPMLPPGADAATIVRSGVAWLVDAGKSEFVGHDAFHAAHAEESSAAVGFETDGQEAVPEGTAVATADGAEVGTVLTSDWSPTLDRTIGLAAIDADLSCVGLHLAAGDRPIVTVASPFILPKSWKTPIL